MSRWTRYPSSLALIATKITRHSSQARHMARAGGKTHKVSSDIEFFLFAASLEHSAIGGMLVLRTGSGNRSAPRKNSHQKANR